MGKSASIFPGQGLLNAGLGKELRDVFAPARQVFNDVDEGLGFRLSVLCFSRARECSQTGPRHPARNACRENSNPASPAGARRVWTASWNQGRPGCCAVWWRM